MEIDYKEQYEELKIEFDELEQEFELERKKYLDYKEYKDFLSHWVHIDEYKKLEKETTDFCSNWVHIDEYLKIKRQSISAAKDFTNTIDILNKVIELLIKDTHWQGNLAEMNDEDIYRTYEDKAIKILRGEKNEK